MAHIASNGFDSKPLNLAFAGLRDRINGSAAPKKPVQVELPLDPVKKPKQTDLPFAFGPSKQRSRKRGEQIRDLMAATQRSRAYCWNLLTVLEHGDGWLIGCLFAGKITVNRALEQVNPKIARTRELTRRFNALPQSVRETLLSLAD